MIKQIKQMRAQQNAQQRAFPTTGSRFVCILMGYKDKAFTKTQADINNLFNQVGYSAGGATDLLRITTTRTLGISLTLLLLLLVLSPLLKT